MTAATRTNGRLYRRRPFNTKAPLQIVYEHEIDHVEGEQRDVQQIETGVERNEEVVRAHVPFDTIFQRCFVAISLGFALAFFVLPPIFGRYRHPVRTFAFGSCRKKSWL